MFSSLRQGSVIYVLEKGDNHSLKIGQVVSVSTPTTNNYLLNSTTLDIIAKVGTEQMEFRGVPSAQNTATINNVFIAETKELMSNEVENVRQNAISIVESKPYYEKVAEDCEQILKEINPQFAKDKERDERLSNLEDKFDSFESKLDKIFELVKK